MPTEKYLNLIAEMPEISKAVNSFTSEEVQKSAFDVLVASLQGNFNSISHLTKTKNNAPVAPKSIPKKTNASTSTRKKDANNTKSGFDPVAFVNDLKEKSEFKILLDGIFHKNNFWDKIRTVLFYADCQLGASDIANTLNALDIKADKSNVSKKLKEKSADLINKDRKRKLTSQCKIDTENWLNALYSAT